MNKVVNMSIINIDGIEYKEEDLSNDLRNTIAARQELQLSKVRHLIELEKIEVLTNFYNEKIKKGIEEYNKNKK
jgi:hypothetical protein